LRLGAVTLTILLAACSQRIALAQGSRSPEVIVDVGVADEVWMRKHKMTEADVNQLVAQLKEAGCQRLHVTCGCLGTFPYRSALEYPFRFDPEHARANAITPFPKELGTDLESYIAQHTAWNNRFADIIHNDFDPPTAFIRAGHQQGMKVYAWIDLFDGGWPGYRSKFLEEHPHCQWVGKDGKTYFKGVWDYAWPEARAFRVAQARELLDRGVDGIHCSARSHARHLPNTHDEDYYGYSEPIVQAFQRKYGIDIRATQDFDRAAWHDLKGEAMLDLYRDLAGLCHSRGKKLCIGLQLGRHTQFAVDDYFSTNVVLRYSNHWRKLVDEGIADELILGDYEAVKGTDWKNVREGGWRVKPDIQLREGEDLYDWASREYQSYCHGKTRLYLFSQWMETDPRKLEPLLTFWADTTRKHSFDGITMHEAWTFEDKPGNMSLLRAMTQRLKAEPSSP